MRIDLHTHSILSDGELTPAELVRRAMVIGHDAIAITDHVDMTNVDLVVPAVVRAAELTEDYIRTIPGVEITHVPPKQIDKVIKRAKKLGAQWIVVHGETVAEPVAPGTNLMAAGNSEVNVLAHPGLITDDVMEKAVRNGVLIEITGRAYHNITNGHVLAVARRFGAKMVVNSDAHAPGNLMDEVAAMKVAVGAGMTEKEAYDAVCVTPFDAVRKLK
ncbi:MAG: histidinol phosphate phosphatase domain-containing protein [Methanomassiliicoccaceae archaeon]|jgi:histidinol phosphatase-like PHP family hydrolase|nr:histidinol phosphate phosphatase domain-containing protein [Methanomassiliicoccaceae archaeon]